MDIFVSAPAFDKYRKDFDLSATGLKSEYEPRGWRPKFDWRSGL
jgi:hypothetical protein